MRASIIKEVKQDLEGLEHKQFEERWYVKYDILE
jgi:hypothetical protein